MARDMTSWFQSKMQHLTEIIHETAEEAAEKGGNITKHHIETRGTDKSGKRGRIETGEMRDNVSSKVTDKQPDSATATFGWIDGTPGYEWFQELGFVHRGGAEVEGMYALTDAREEVVDDLKEDLRSRIRGL